MGGAGSLTGPQEFIAEHNTHFKRRRDLVVKMLNEADGIECITPEGRFTFIKLRRMHRQDGA